jgi:hypothetical protein
MQWCAASALSLTTAHTLSTACMGRTCPLGHLRGKERWVGLGVWSACRCDRIDPFSVPWLTPARRAALCGGVVAACMVGCVMQLFLSQLSSSYMLSTDPAACMHLPYGARVWEGAVG